MNHLVFLDFETTGLDPSVHHPLEVAAVVTNNRFFELAKFEALIDLPECCVWAPEALAMHEASGLKAAAELHGRPPHYVLSDLGNFLVRVAGQGPLHLAGNSVHFDRGFLRVHAPNVERLFHHRHLDVSSIRMLGERVTMAPSLGGEKPHRAMQDVRRSIAELHHWTAAIRSGAPF